MLSNYDKYLILNYHRKGYGTRKISELTGFARGTVKKYIREDRELRRALDKAEVGSVEHHQIMERIADAPVSKARGQERVKKKRTPELEAFVDKLLEDDARKDELYGKDNKIKMSAKDIYEIVKDAGFKISYSSITKLVREKRQKHREVFIQQHYDYGDRLEFDFGERKVTIAGKVRKVYVAVFCSPATKYRSFFLYNNKSNEAFVDSHVRFFQEVGGVYKTIVYDNMRNVVKKFVGRTGRELTDQIISLANYYGFEVMTTNTYAGNEKGSVENSVKLICNRLFSRKDVFESWDELFEHAQKVKTEINKEIDLEKEKKCLKPAKDPYENAIRTQQKTNKYGYVRVDKNDYSVPEEFTGATLTIKTFPNSIEIYSNDELIASHTRLFETGQASVKLDHYLKTLLRKPGALTYSEALGQVPKLKEIYDSYYTDKVREFLETIIDNKDLLDTDGLAELLISRATKSSVGQEKAKTTVEKQAENQLESLVDLFEGEKGESDRKER